MSLVLDHTYRYDHPSALEVGASLRRLFLATTAAPAGLPLYFRGVLRRPRLVADLLLALGRVIRTRFHTPASARTWMADPVITVADDRLRLEGFSSCCGVFARVDLLEEALDGSVLGHGTTNVDFNPPFRAALSRVGDGDPVRLTVGRDDVELQVGEREVVERRVPLPVRWLKGFVEAQAIQARMSLRLEAEGSEARAFLRGLPRAGVKEAHVVAAGRGLRLSQRPGGGSVRIAATERLHVLDDLGRHIGGLRVYAGAGGSAWELTLPGARFTLGLSEEAWRGFSGEGQVLADLARASDEPAGEAVRAALRWQGRVDAAALAEQCGLSPGAVHAALARLGSRGIVGYDLAEASYFHRELPYDYTTVEALHPRLAGARDLAEQGGVSLDHWGNESPEAWVRGADVEHRVTCREGEWRCSCPWWARHRGERGPCKHVLAVRMRLGELE